MATHLTFLGDISLWPMTLREQKEWAAHFWPNDPFKLAVLRMKIKRVKARRK